MKYAINVGYVLATLAILLGLIGNREEFLIVGAIFYGTSTIALAIQSRTQSPE